MGGLGESADAFIPVFENNFLDVYLSTIDKQICLNPHLRMPK